MIYISLTTVPDRFAHEETFKENLNSLLHQTAPNDYRILLNIPHVYRNYDNFNLPEWITTYHDKITIIRGDGDYGPITNLLYPLKYVEMEDDDIIIVVDDDHVYHPELISHHLQKHTEYPENHAICYRGNYPMELRTWVEEETLVGVFLQTHTYFPVKHDVYVLLPDHWHSVSYKKKWFDADIFDKEFLEMTWNNDNLMGYYAYKKGFYFLCAAWDNETDFRQVSTLGRDSNSYPVTKPLPYESNSGCNLWRERVNVDVTQNSEFMKVFNDRGVIPWRYTT
jgi:hypothetical protein